MRFLDQPSTEDMWRAIILFGRNAASYKFALAKSLLELTEQGRTFVTLEELALPFSRHVASHLQNADKQTTSSSSSFLDACRRFNRAEITQEALVQETVKRGFTNVIDAFHIISRGETPRRFFVDDRSDKRGITLTDDLLRFREAVQHPNFALEVEARWRLVESAWELGINPGLIEVKHDNEGGRLFVINSKLRRTDVTSAREALNGYQKGKCFYCLVDMQLTPGELEADVDHFLPWRLSLIQEGASRNLNGIWNLVLACRECNRGVRGKFDRVPHHDYIVRLHQRNNFLIESHHPLRETLVAQTGRTESARRSFLHEQYGWAKSRLIHEWRHEKKLGGETLIDSIPYYEHNAVRFFDGTVALDMEPLYRPFLELVPAAGRILDVGCGSGRDTKFFSAKGYRVDAFDGSAEMCALASRHAGVPVRHLRFEDIVYKAEFDGIWASASLLHVPRQNLEAVLAKLIQALKSGGVMFASFKERKGEWREGERCFYGYTEDSLRAEFSKFSNMQLLRMWKTDDPRPDRKEQWLNVLVGQIS